MAREVKGKSVSMKFAVGETASGGTKVMSVSIGRLYYGYYDADKAMSIASAVSEAYSQVLVEVVETETATLTNG